MARAFRPSKKRVLMLLVVVLVVGGALYLMGRQDGQSVAPTVTTSPTTPAVATPSASPSSTAPVASPPVATPAASSSAKADITSIFNGYTIALPAGSVLVDSAKGKYGDVRTTYRTPAGETLMTIAFSGNFGWSEFSEEQTTRCPTASEGKQVPITWGGSFPGGYTGWNMKGCAKDMVTFTTFSDVENVAVVYYGASTPPQWLVRAIELARWTE